MAIRRHYWQESPAPPLFPSLVLPHSKRASIAKGKDRRLRARAAPSRHPCSQPATRPQRAWKLYSSALFSSHHRAGRAPASLGRPGWCGRSPRPPVQSSRLLCWSCVTIRRRTERGDSLPSADPSLLNFVLLLPRRLHSCKPSQPAEPPTQKKPLPQPSLCTALFQNRAGDVLGPGQRRRRATEQEPSEPSPPLHI